MRTLAVVPQHSQHPYVDTYDTVSRMEALVAGPRGVQSMRLRMTVEDIVRFVEPKDRLSQAKAIYDWFMANWSYLNEADEVELVKDPERILEEIAGKGRALGDCDDAATFLAAAFRTIGIPARFARATFTRSGAAALQEGLRGDADPHSHVFVVIRDQHKRDVSVDPVAGGHTREMLGRITGATVGLGGWLK
jgi:transglutaminase-like putative cysteine protease